MQGRGTMFLLFSGNITRPLYYYLFYYYYNYYNDFVLMKHFTFFLKIYDFILVTFQLFFGKFYNCINSRNIHPLFFLKLFWLYSCIIQTFFLVYYEFILVIFWHFSFLGAWLLFWKVWELRLWACVCLVADLSAHNKPEPARGNQTHSHTAAPRAVSCCLEHKR